jgi:Zn ribbon nucleic-acid-binding protein
VSIQFVCPTCEARHDRGFVNGVNVFRCLRCGYTGHGFHSDGDIDWLLYKEHQAANAFNRTHGIPEVPLGVDPLNGPG